MSSYSAKPKVLITGGSGQLASALLHHPRAQAFQIHCASRAELDICNKKTLEHVLDHSRPDVLINTAAYTAVDQAEQERETALRVNYHGAAYAAEVCKRYQTKLIHLSTDYIFDGKKTSPYHENEAACPINLYGESKWLGEEAVREASSDHVILRTSGVFSEYGHNFLKTILRLAREKTHLRVVADQMTSPTSAHDIASAIFTLAANAAKGTYHYCSDAQLSWYEFAAAIINAAAPYLSGTLAELEAVPAAAYQTLAARPLYSVLDCSRIYQEHGIAQPSLTWAVKQIVYKLLGKS